MAREPVTVLLSPREVWDAVHGVAAKKVNWSGWSKAEILTEWNQKDGLVRMEIRLVDEKPHE